MPVVRAVGCVDSGRLGWSGDARRCGHNQGTNGGQFAGAVENSPAVRRHPQRSPAFHSSVPSYAAVRTQARHATTLVGKRPIGGCGRGVFWAGGPAGPPGPPERSRASSGWIPAAAAAPGEARCAQPRRARRARFSTGGRCRPWGVPKKVPWPPAGRVGFLARLVGRADRSEQKPRPGAGRGTTPRSPRGCPCRGTRHRSARVGRKVTAGKMTAGKEWSATRPVDAGQAPPRARCLIRAVSSCTWS